MRGSLLAVQSKGNHRNTIMKRRINVYHQVCLFAAASLALLLMAVSGAWAAPDTTGTPPAPSRLDAAERARVIDGVLRRLNEGYIFPDVARKMEAYVRERAAATAYDHIKDGPALAQALTGDLRAISKDLHISVAYSADALPQMAPMQKPAPEEWEKMRRAQARENFGLAKVDILPGNVGYLDFRYFTALEFAQDTYSGAVAVVANTEALIIDLRRCGGSMSPDALPFLLSYLFAEPTRLSEIYWRHSDSTQQFWTLPTVPGRRYLHRPVYILTSGQTFSGAEGMAYDLQSLKRATIVGDVTGGGANPGGSQRVDDHFAVWVPVGKVTNHITKTNWEGSGVTPDVKVPAPLALTAAHVDALKKIAAAERDPARKEQLNAALAEVEQAKAKWRRVSVSLKGYAAAKEVLVAGSFNQWTPRSGRLERRGDAWVGEVLAEPGQHTYKFIVDGEWMTDPANPKTARDGQFENSVLAVE